MKKVDVNTLFSTDVSGRAAAQDLPMQSLVCVTAIYQFALLKNIILPNLVNSISNIQGSLRNAWCNLCVKVNISVKRLAG